MVYGTQITIVMGVYKPTYNWAAPHHIATGTSPIEKFKVDRC
jgi:hypothetical protein